MRCNNTYGRTQDANFFTEYVIKSMLNGGPVYVGTPDHVRDYMYVDDHVNAYLLAVEKEMEASQSRSVLGLAKVSTSAHLLNK